MIPLEVEREQSYVPSSWSIEFPEVELHDALDRQTIAALLADGLPAARVSPSVEEDAITKVSRTAIAS